MAMTFGSLVDDVASYLDRNDTSTLDKIPYFISLAELRCCQDAPFLFFVNYFMDTLNPDVAVYAKPAIWKQNISFKIGTGTGFNTYITIPLRTYDYLRMYWPNPTLTGQPVYYANYDQDHFILGPTPDLAYPFELGAITQPDPLGPSISTNTLTRNAPNLLFYATLLEAVPYVKRYQDVEMWKAEYKEILSRLIEQDKRNYQDRQSNREAD